MLRLSFLLILVMAQPVFAQGMFSGGNWVSLVKDAKTNSETGEVMRVEYLTKKSSIKIIGDNQYRLKLLINMVPAALDVGSYLWDMELNCDNLNTRIVQMSGYSQPYAKGKQDFNFEGDGKWDPLDRSDQGWAAVIDKLCGP